MAYVVPKTNDAAQFLTDPHHSADIQSPTYHFNSHSQRHSPNYPPKSPHTTSQTAGTSKRLPTITPDMERARSRTKHMEEDLAAHIPSGNLSDSTGMTNLPKRYGSVKRKPVPPINLPLTSSTSSLPGPSFTRQRTSSGSGSEKASKFTFSPQRRAQRFASSGSRSSSISAVPQKYSGNSSDGGTAIPVDMKRLLSKPARTHKPCGSVLSIPSDTLALCNPQPAHKSAHAKASSSPNRSDKDFRHAERDVATAPSEHSHMRERQPSASTLGYEASSSRNSSRHSSRQTSNPELEPQKSRNVLKRRPSATNKPSSAPALVRPVAGCPLGPKPSLGYISRGLPTGSDPASRSHRPPGRVIDTSTKPKNLPTPTSALTPAGAVAEAYKQQEMRRDDLASYTRSGDLESMEIMGQDDLDEERCATPYYTILGSTSGRVVAVGGPQDDAWNLNFDTYVHSATELERSRSAKANGMKRTLSRKVSGKLKKVVGSAKKEGSLPSSGISPSNADQQDQKVAKPTSLQQRRSRDRRRSLSVSVQKHVDLTPVKSGSQSVPPTTSHKAGVRTGKVVFAEGFDNEAGSRKSEPSLNGVKLWKLMKRISTGGLRDRFHDPQSPPPVPALPKGFAEVRSHDGHGESPGFVNRFIQSRPSLSANNPPSHTHRSVTSPIVPPRPSKKGIFPSVSGAGPNTRSPSPISSDKSSSKFFNKPHSSRSSSSSYGDELPPPPVPTTLISQHIISPKELYRLDRDQEKNFMYVKELPPPPLKFEPLGDWISQSPDVERKPLPFPPRHSSNNRLETRQWDQESNLSSSPIIPSFSTADAINDFSTERRPPLSLVVPLSALNAEGASLPPPLPPKSPMRRLNSRPAEAEDFQPPSDFRMSSGALSDASTARQRPRSNSLGSMPLFTHPPLKFRELGAESDLPWTEQEKTAKWDDLLERSARAGGTLHLRGTELDLDVARFSEYLDLSF